MPIYNPDFRGMLLIAYYVVNLCVPENTDIFPEVVGELVFKTVIHVKLGLLEFQHFVRLNLSDFLHHLYEILSLLAETKYFSPQSAIAVKTGITVFPKSVKL